MKQQICYQKNIMIVEDNPEIANGLKEVLEKYCIQVTTKDNDKDCLLELEKGFEGIIIFDLMPQVMNSINTIKKIINEGFIDQNTIIVITEKLIQGNEFDEVYPYIYGYITKPIDVNILLYKIKKIAMQLPPKNIL